MADATLSISADAIAKIADRVDWIRLARQWIDCQSVIADRKTQFSVIVDYVRQREWKRFRFLELCAGPGCQSEVLLTAFPESVATVFEYNPFFQEMARRYIGRLTNRFTVVGTDLRRSEWATELEGNYDLIVSADALVGHPQDTLINIYRGIFHLLKPGGTFLNCDYVRSEDEPTQEIFRRVKQARSTDENRKAWEKFWADVDEALNTKDYGSRWLGELISPGGPGMNGYTMQQQVRMLAEAGFQASFSLWQHYGDRVYGASR